MTSPAEEHAYRWQRRYIFAVTLAFISLLPIVWLLF